MKILKSSLHSEFAKLLDEQLEQKLDKKMAQKLDPLVLKLDPSNFNHIPNDPFDYGTYMHVEETFDQSGTHLYYLPRL